MFRFSLNSGEAFVRLIRVAYFTVEHKTNTRYCLSRLRRPPSSSLDAALCVATPESDGTQRLSEESWADLAGVPEGSSSGYTTADQETIYGNPIAPQRASRFRLEAFPT